MLLHPRTNCWYVPCIDFDMAGLGPEVARTMILGYISSNDLFRLCLFQRSQCSLDFFGIRYSPNPTSFGTTSPNLLTNQVSPNLAWSKAEPSLCSGVVIKIFNAVPPSNGLSSLACQ